MNSKKLIRNGTELTKKKHARARGIEPLGGGAPNKKKPYKNLKTQVLYGLVVPTARVKTFASQTELQVSPGG